MARTAVAPACSALGSVYGSDIAGGFASLAVGGAVALEFRRASIANVVSVSKQPSSRRFRVGRVWALAASSVGVKAALGTPPLQRLPRKLCAQIPPLHLSSTKSASSLSS